ncbi:hypothetical protein HDU91_001417, partial [Kappamyces sp. JEL0680]
MSTTAAIFDMIANEHGAGFLLSFFASMGTFLGGILVVFLIGILGADPSSPSTSYIMGLLQSVSAGVMVHMTCFHLIPESNATIGTRETMTYFFIGVLLFGLLELIVMPGHSHEDHDDHTHKDEPSTPRSPRKMQTRKKSKNDGGRDGPVKNISKEEAAALYRTSLITFIAMTLHNIPEGISVYLASLSNPRM